ncbi:hypothetical protein OCF63_12210 [Bacillus wiedmannii]|uniref:Uncharacterized protein n=1 Tax=Bacillus cytotoxicus TaxID=580165 RepID=A0ACC6A3W6_9BACI|nr:hypothetical protein [Bacillus wiedmannii]MCM3735584.1 hypothetical protein [Bacillus cytotoxicus]MCU5498760.1 hypothetical protein [Bacillus wiedmannii]
MEIKVKDLVLNYIQKGSKYKIIHYDKNNGFTVYKCEIGAIDSTSIFMLVFEMNGEEVDDARWMHWREIDAIEKIQTK